MHRLQGSATDSDPKRCSLSHRLVFLGSRWNQLRTGHVGHIVFLSFGELLLHRCKLHRSRESESTESFQDQAVNAWSQWVLVDPCSLAPSDLVDIPMGVGCQRVQLIGSAPRRTGSRH